MPSALRSDGCLAHRHYTSRCTLPQESSPARPCNLAPAEPSPAARRGAARCRPRERWDDGSRDAAFRSREVGHRPRGLVRRRVPQPRGARRRGRPDERGGSVCMAARNAASVEPNSRTAGARSRRPTPLSPRRKRACSSAITVAFDHVRWRRRRSAEARAAVTEPKWEMHAATNTGSRTSNPGSPSACRMRAGVHRIARLGSFAAARARATEPK
jgi:hypothetical protein